MKHAGLAPREKLSGTFVGRTKLTGQGRPALRLAAWRAVWGAQRANPVYAAMSPQERAFFHKALSDSAEHVETYIMRYRPDISSDPRHP